MPVVRTIYRPAVDTHDEVSLTAGGTLCYPVRDSADAVVAATETGSSMVVLDAAGKVLITKAVTTSATLTATAALTPAEMAAAGLTYGYCYRTRWTLVLATDTEVFDNLLGIVRVPFPYSPLRVADLTDLHHGLSTWIEGSGATLGSWIDRGWQKCTRWLRLQEHRPSAIISPADVKDLASAWTLELIMLDLSTGRTDSPFMVMAEHYVSERKAAQASLVFTADVDQDDTVDGDQAGTPPFFMSRVGGYRYRTL